MLALSLEKFNLAFILKVAYHTRILSLGASGMSSYPVVPVDILALQLRFRRKF
jgi:hypothetical protein